MEFICEINVADCGRNEATACTRPPGQSPRRPLFEYSNDARLHQLLLRVFAEIKNKNEVGLNDCGNVQMMSGGFNFYERCEFE